MKLFSFEVLRFKPSAIALGIPDSGSMAELRAGGMTAEHQQLDTHDHIYLRRGLMGL